MVNRRSAKMFGVLCVLEGMVGVVEIGLALLYLCGVVLVASEMPDWQVVGMVGVYGGFVGVFLWSAVVGVRSGKRKTAVPRGNLLAVAVVAGVLACYLAVQMVVGLLMRSVEGYFVLSFSWNVPRLVLDLTTVVCCVVMLRKTYR